MHNNIYSIQTDLAKLQLTDLSERRQKFIRKIIEGNPDPTQGWDKINSLAKSINIIQLKNLIQAIENERENEKKILRDSYFCVNPYSYFAYKNALKNVLKTLKWVVAINTFEGIETDALKLTEYFSRTDHLFSETHKKYNGEVMLPVMQSFDARLADSQGECSGYIVQWALSLLDNHMAFGINAKEPPPFRTIPFNPQIKTKYKNINHLAFLTEKISKYQNDQHYSSLLKNEGFNFTDVTKRQSLKSIEKLAQELIAYADKSASFIYFSNFIYYISFIGYKSHAAGFCKLGSQYHFFDSNTGWFRFENSNDFENWLPFYFKLNDLKKKYIDYSISTISVISLIEEENQQKEEKNKKLTPGKLAVISLLLLFGSPVIVPTIVLTGVGVCGMVVGLVTKNIALPYYYLVKQTLRPNEPFLIGENDNSVQTISTYNLSQSPLIDALDLATHPKLIAPKPQKTFNNPYIDNDALSCTTAALGFFASRKGTNHPIRHPEYNEGSPKYDIVPQSERSFATLGMTKQLHSNAPLLANNKPQSKIKDNPPNEYTIFNPLYQSMNADDSDTESEIYNCRRYSDRNSELLQVNLNNNCWPHPRPNKLFKERLGTCSLVLQRPSWMIPTKPDNSQFNC